MKDEYLSFINLLNEYEVEYILLGGYAVIVHGFVRTTGDVDFLINPTPQNADKLLMVMLKFGYEPYDFEQADFTAPNVCVSLDRYDGKIEILTETLGVTFDECFKNKFIFETEGVLVNVISLPDLIKNKQAVGRPKDLEDIRNLPTPD